MSRGYQSALGEELRPFVNHQQVLVSEPPGKKADPAVLVRMIAALADILTETS